MTDQRAGQATDAPAVGESRESVGRTVTNADLVTWGGLVHDFTRLHFDQEHMKSTPFGQPIAHGYIALNLSIGLMFPELARWYSPHGTDTALRWNDVRFLSPVFVGDTLRCRRTVTTVTTSEVHYLVEVIKGDEVVVSGTEVVGRSLEEAASR